MSLKTSAGEFGVKYILELRQVDNPRIAVYRKEFDTKDQAISVAVAMHRGHVVNDNNIYYYLLYKVYLVGAVRVVDKQIENLDLMIKQEGRR